MTVVGLVAEGEDPWALPPAWPAAQPSITDGVRELYRALAAAAAAGERVEVRGPVVHTELDGVCVAAGVTVDRPGDARMPTADDVVVVLDGQPDAAFYARRMLSPARTAILAPRASGRREHLVAMAALGFAVWSDFTAAGVRAALGALRDDPARPARGEMGRLLADERLGLLGLANEARAQAEAARGTMRR